MEEAKRAPKRRRVECRLIEKESAREVTFSKRHQGLFRKAAELSLLCGADVAVITYSPHGNPFAFAHPSTPDGLVDRYLSGDVTRDDAAAAAGEAAAYRKRYEDSVAKLEEAKREAARTAAEAGKRKWWLDEAVVDGMEEEELEHYVASLEALQELIADRVGQCGDSGFYTRLMATDMDISMDMDAAFLAELQYSC
ncbi:agamous-like MADS-box protein AGL61 [Rhodamnia argentea]|uniref:Agamous-like MADS-box protein AGL61 n=1 Tax=Rhodamnia argentea TaxID=178133 RepID=A0ABM3H6S5_9MYRT|nr:agamous-like MADS-box protein AGL61 [Rhodamnia argentea]